MIYYIFQSYVLFFKEPDKDHIVQEGESTFTNTTTNIKYPSKISDEFILLKNLNASVS